MMTRGKHMGRKTQRVVRLPATKFAKLQKKLGKGPVPGKLTTHSMAAKKHKDRKT